MSWSKKIDNKNYGLGSAVNLGLAVAMGYPSTIGMLALVYVVIGSILNQYFTIMALLKLVKRHEAESEETVNKRQLFFYITLKAFFLISAFLCLVTYSREKVLYGLLGYTFQLIILFLSIKNIGQFFKKGTPP